MGLDAAAAIGAGFLGAWSGRDSGAFAALTTARIHYEDPLTDGPLIGTPALAGHAERLWDAMPDARLEASGEPVAQGRFLAVPARLTGTQSGPLGDLPPSGRRLRVHCVFYCELDREPAPEADVRLARVRAFFDLYDAGVQAGMIPGRGSLREKALLMLQGFGLRAGEEEPPPA